MKELKISIYKGDSKKPETEVKIPLTGLKIVKDLVPKKAREKLAKKGVDIEKIIKSIEKEKKHGKLLEIQDKEDHIIISVE
jgi:hypothetical protein